MHPIFLLSASYHEEVAALVSELQNSPRNIKLLNTGKRDGLIRARVFGARQATGEVS